MTATVTIITAQRDDVLRVPLRALRFHPDRKPEASETPTAQRESERRSVPSVWVLQPDGTLRKVEAKTGVRSDQYAELVSGELHDGDQLAVAFRSAAKRATSQVPASLGAAVSSRYGPTAHRGAGPVENLPAG